MSTHSPRLVLFDLDLTVLSVNSVGGWIKRERRLGRIGAFQTYKAVFHLLRYRYGGADMSNAITQGIKYLEGEQEAAFRLRTQDYWKEELINKIRPGAFKCLSEHRRLGDHIALLTSSSIYLAEVAADFLDIPHVLAMRFEVIDGSFSGRPCYPICHGKGKVAMAESLADQLGVSMSEAIFYTDSFSDIPTLEAVGRPFLVHPDHRLRQMAQQRNWPILNWD